jgi:DnaJ-class molecular chaperone
MKRQTENTRQRGIPQPRKKWSDRCNVCLGRGEIIMFFPRYHTEKCEKCDGKGKVEQ